MHGWDLGADTGKGHSGAHTGMSPMWDPPGGMGTCRRGHPRGHRPVWPVAGAAGLCQQLWQDHGGDSGGRAAVAGPWQWQRQHPRQMLCKRKGTELEMVKPLNTGCRVVRGFPHLWVPQGHWCIHGKSRRKARGQIGSITGTCWGPPVLPGTSSPTWSPGIPPTLLKTPAPGNPKPLRPSTPSWGPPALTGPQEPPVLLEPWTLPFLPGSPSPSGASGISSSAGPPRP